MKRQNGFTMVELITVMVLLGVLAAIGVPRLMGDNGTGAVVFGDQVKSALRLAHKNAVARRRVVCVQAAGTTVSIRIRQAPGLGACDNAMLDGLPDAGFASNSNKLTVANAPATLFFRPDGTVSDSAAGTPLGRTELHILASGAIERSITLQGSTGHVE